MAQLVHSNLLEVLSFALVFFNACMSIWVKFDRKVLLFINFLLYLVLFFSLRMEEGGKWFGQEQFNISISYLSYFAVMMAVTCLLFLNREERFNGPLFTSVFLVLNLSLLYSTNILKISIILILFEILELLVLSREKNPQKSMLTDLALTKLFSIISLLMAVIFIVIARGSTSLFETEIQNYDLYYMGICLFIVYILSVLYIAPLDEIKEENLLNSSSFSVIFAVLFKLVILGTVIISMLKRLILVMEPHAQEEILSGLKIVIFIAMISLILRAMSRNSRGKVTYYLFCLNNILPLFAIYGLEEIDIKLMFFLFALSSLGLFAGTYVEKNNSIFMNSRSKGLIFIFYFLGLMSLWGAPTTAVFKTRYLLIEGILSIDTVLLLVIFMLISGFLWYPVVISLREKLKENSPQDQVRHLGILERVGLVWVSAQIILLNYSNLLIE